MATRKLSNRNLVIVLVSMIVTGASGTARSTLIDHVSFGELLRASRHSLVGGIRHAEKIGVAPLSATFEVERGKLQLSVYAAKNGIRVDAEHNRLVELEGAADDPIFDPTPELFQDAPRVARSATQLTLLQVASMSLEDAINQAGATHDGIAYSAVPEVREGRAVVRVLLLGATGDTVTVDVPLQSEQRPTR